MLCYVGVHYFEERAGPYAERRSKYYRRSAQPPAFYRCAVPPGGPFFGVLKNYYK